jgi:hypothetical protein
MDGCVNKSVRGAVNLVSKPFLEHLPEAGLKLSRAVSTAAGGGAFLGVVTTEDVIEWLERPCTSTT